MNIKDLLNKPTPSVAALAVKYNVSAAVVQQQLDQGSAVELEHTDDPQVAAEIALDHLAEDLYYYQKLKRMETGASESVRESLPLQSGFQKMITDKSSVGQVSKHHMELYDQILTILCDMIDYQFTHNPEKYGEVGAAIVDPHSRIVVALSTPSKGKWRHAEFNAIVAYNKKYGEIPQGSVVITTCSPCSARMPDRQGDSCTHRINEQPIPIVYCGFEDPTQHTHLHNFQLVITQNAHIHHRCEKHAQRFMDWELLQQNQHDPDTHSRAAQKANQLL